MEKEKLKIVDAKIIPSTIKECKEVLITYRVNGGLEHYYAFVDKNEKNPINAAKKEFDSKIKNGKVSKKNPFIAATLGIVSAVALTMTGLFVWKTLTATGGGEEPQPQPVPPGPTPPGPTPDEPGNPSKPLTFVCLKSGGAVYFTYESYPSGEVEIPIRKNGIDLEYQIDDGEWTKVTGLHQTVDKYDTYTIKITDNLKIGQEVHLRGDNDYWSYIPYVPNPDEEIDWNCDELLSLTTSGNFSVKNNIMSLLHKENFEFATDVGIGCFAFAFSPFYSSKMTSDTYDASQLILPKMDELPVYCYNSMFSGSNLITAPEEIMKEDCSISYSSLGFMFSECHLLLHSPKQIGSANSELDESGCGYMFNGCISLREAPALPAITLAEWCYSGMFRNCYSLTKAPELPASTLESGCYNEMFINCYNLLELKVGFGASGWPNTGTVDWLENVGIFDAYSGNFYWKGSNSGMEIQERFGSTVPQYWSIYHYE